MRRSPLPTPPTPPEPPVPSVSLDALSAVAEVLTSVVERVSASVAESIGAAVQRSLTPALVPDQAPIPDPALPTTDELERIARQEVMDPTDGIPWLDLASRKTAAMGPPLGTSLGMPGGPPGFVPSRDA